MTADATIETTQDERVMAALAHFFGLIAALLVWATQKDKSRFLRFQALQALAFDALLVIVIPALTMCMVVVMIAGAVALGAAAAGASKDPESIVGLTMLTTLFPMSLFLCIMPASLAALLIRVIAAVSVASGRNFRYPLIAERVDKFLEGPAAAGS